MHGSILYMPIFVTLSKHAANQNYLQTLQLLQSFTSYFSKDRTEFAEDLFSKLSVPPELCRVISKQTFFPVVGVKDLIAGEVKVFVFLLRRAKIEGDVATEISTQGFIGVDRLECLLIICWTAECQFDVDIVVALNRSLLETFIEVEAQQSSHLWTSRALSLRSKK